MKTRAHLINALEVHRQNQLHHEMLAHFDERVIAAWIFHDNLLEDRCFEPEYIKIALKREDHKLPSYLRPILEDIRIYESAIQMIHTWAEEGPQGLTVARMERLHEHLLQHEPKEGARIRKNSPVHRNSQQQICAHPKVSNHLASLFEELVSFDAHNDDVISYAAQLQHRLMFIYPYRRQPGNIARLITNQFLLAHRYPPIVIASHERGTYYDAVAAHDATSLTQLFYQSMWCMLDILPDLSESQPRSTRRAHQRSHA